MLVTGNAPGNDMRFYWERLDDCRNFNNKLWNASRFVMMNLESDEEEDKLLYLTGADKWILSKVNTLAKDVTESLGLTISIYQSQYSSQRKSRIFCAARPRS